MPWLAAVVLLGGGYVLNAASLEVWNVSSSLKPITYSTRSAGN